MRIVQAMLLEADEKTVLAVTGSMRFRFSLPYQAGIFPFAKLLMILLIIGHGRSFLLTDL